MNQYRCETCKHYDKDNFLWRCGYISKKFNVAITTGELDNEVFRYIQSCVGCASHSDFQSGWDTVLERLHIWFENYCEGNEEADLWMAFIHAERTLRQAGEPDV